ncbi:MAG: [LysW]-lysine hydrolase [Chloroflexi bacterium]|nr:[LysW]-lysine hydrolase [Chloroflexota bacterium]
MSIDPVVFLEELIKIKSLSGEETAVAQTLVSQMANLGLTARIDEVGNAIGVRECPDENGAITHEIVLLGHMDTVPGDIPVQIVDGKLYGRGSVDAKGPLAAFVMAAAQADLSPGTRVVLIGAVEEEAATSKGARHMVNQYRPDWCIIGEPSGWDGVTLGYKGRLLIDYEYRQPMSHTAGQQRGAAEVGIAWYNRLSDTIKVFNFEESRLFNQLLPSIHQIQTSSDGLTNSITIKVGIRLPPRFDVDEFQAEVEEWVGEAMVRFYGREAAFQSTRSTPLARAFIRALQPTGRKPRFKLKTGTSDMNIVGPVWNCPIVAYGPGDSRLDHTPEEHLALEDYLRAIEVLKTVISIQSTTSSLKTEH